ncbi:MAG: hypothetical protein CL569_10200 [Alphaproteobacteria bacterium]|nr:hypothetical protein [Alphaproteobacteria bacterium]|tara:strand:+ start:2435 stop:2944 length:510 start_codon:yes stop_codon:yes gene_type:complete
MTGVGSSDVFHHRVSRSIGIVFSSAVIAAATSAALAAGPQLPPVEFKSPPTGTEIEYDSFASTVRRPKDFETLCVDSGGGKIRHYSHFQLFDDLPNVEHIQMMTSLDCPAEYRYTYSVRRVELNQDAKEALKSLWPLKVGNKATYEVQTRHYNSRVESDNTVSFELTGT